VSVTLCAMIVRVVFAKHETLPLGATVACGGGTFVKMWRVRAIDVWHVSR
jgi:hypothetical protein